MVKHVVLWKLKDSAEGHTKEENGKIIKDKLEALPGRIEGLTEMSVGFNFSQKGEGFDLCLVSKFKDRKALEFYDTHPLHEEVRSYVRKVISDRLVADFE